jgi:hypothetical protein
MHFKSLVFALGMAAIAAAADYSGKLGMNFIASSTATAGLRYHFGKAYCLNPQLGFSFRDERQGDDFILSLIVGNLIYLPELASIDPYIDISPAFTTANDGDLDLGASFGAQYQVNQTVSLFGEAGLQFGLTGDFTVTTFTSGAGVALYFN